MALKVVTLPMPSPMAVGQGAAVRIAGATAYSGQVSGTFVGTVHVQGSYDGTTWFDMMWNGSASFAITGPDILNGIQGAPPAYLRVNVTAYTSGTPVVTIGVVKP